MQLPDDSIGISDILGYRECPQRFAFGMRRHVELPSRFQIEPGEKDDPEEGTNYANAYGSAIHDAIQVVEETQCSDEDAMDAVWPRWQHWLEPADIDRMKDDLATYRSRSLTGYRVVGTELELRMPLFQHEGRTIYFRGRIDVLYQRIDNPSVFVMRDYKSSRWPKSEKEVHEDVQQWSYNVLVHESYPECESLVQVYDQLRFGDTPTRKSAKQREQMRSWLVRQVKAILADDKLKPHMNEWCPYCPLVTDCRVTHRASDYWKNRIAAIAPEKKVGRKIVVQLTEDHIGMEEYAELLPKVKLTVKTLERFVEAVEGAMKEMPADRREELGYILSRPRRLDTFDAGALRRIHQLVGDDFFHLVGITKKAVEDFYGDNGGSPREEIMALATTKHTAPSLKPSK